MYFGAYSERYIAVKRQRGIAITTARTVTQIDPIINGKKPNSPRKGCQEVENNNSDNGLMARIGLDLRYNPMAIRNTSSPEKIVKKNMNLPAILSFNSLIFCIISSIFFPIIYAHENATLQMLP